jgi:DNA polymerase V
VPEDTIVLCYRRVRVGPRRSVPFYHSPSTQAGFPSPAADYIETRIDLNEALIRNRETTFLVTVRGDSMRDGGIISGCTLVVDKSLRPKDGSIVIASVDGQLLVKRLRKCRSGLMLVSDNPSFDPIEIVGDTELVIWGVVTFIIQKAS